MSAWDISGAVMWTVLALLAAFGIYASLRADDTKAAASALVWMMASMAASIFCIARLFGAHL